MSRNHSWPRDPAEVRQRLLDVVRQAADEGREAVIRIVAVRGRNPTEWCPFFGRIDLVRPGELSEPEADDTGSVLVLVERVQASEFLRRLTDAVAGAPLTVRGVPLREHRMEKEWYPHVVDSANSPGELAWPALDVRTFRLSQGEIGGLLEGRSVVYSGLDHVIQNTCGFEQYYSRDDDRRHVISIIVWDYRGRITELTVERQSVRLKVETSGAEGWRAIGSASTPTGRVTFKFEQPSVNTQEFGEDIYEAEAILRYGADEVDERRAHRPPPNLASREEGQKAKLVLGDSGMVRVLELLRRCDVREGRERFHVSLFKRVCRVLRERDGIDLEGLDFASLEDVCTGAANSAPEDATVAVFLSATWEHLRVTAGLPLSAEDFEARVNAIMSAESAAYRLASGCWLATGETDAEALRRVLLRGEEEAAGCRQGDQQVEMVVSTVQALLSRPGAVLVDYGAGLGRVLAGLAQASRFQSAEYVAVDEPIPDEVRALAGTTGASARFVARTEFLASPVHADAIMIVNTLHHIPFRDVPKQMAVLLRALKPGGMLLVHEMGELREPEQRNVPWRGEDLHELFDGPAFSINARSTVSRSGIPLCHALVGLCDEATVDESLDQNIRRVWTQMKTRTLDEIAQLYRARDEVKHVALQQALIVNANLDLNAIG